MTPTQHTPVHAVMPKRLGEPESSTTTLPEPHRTLPSSLWTTRARDGPVRPLTRAARPPGQGRRAGQARPAPGIRPTPPRSPCWDTAAGLTDPNPALGSRPGPGRAAGPRAPGPGDAPDPAPQPVLGYGGGVTGSQPVLGHGRGAQRVPGPGSGAQPVPGDTDPITRVDPQPPAAIAVPAGGRRGGKGRPKRGLAS